MRRRLVVGWVVAVLHLNCAGATAVGGGKPAADPPRAEPEWHLPGAEAHAPELRARLAAALGAKGPDYRPRTRHLRSDGSAEYTNRLLLESSPYLLQHAHNPVDWYPWGEEAFAAARRLNRPILLSIGYSTCHWCHVMEEESFEDEEIAAFLNSHYIAIKVDREERPDIDAVYMQAVQMMTGRGGWPMTTWLTPERQPFFGGTYFPARDGDRGSRKGFLTWLREMALAYEEQPEQVTAQAAQVATRIRLGMQPPPGEAEVDTGALDKALTTYASLFDDEHGGLARAPKFPSTLPLRLLLREWWRTGETRYRDMADLSLRRMASGGIYDQIGGGFHRYSVDARWLVPHFEKMLYDNALLTLAYLEGFQATGDESFARVADEVLRYVAREMAGPEGGFYSATDADSLAPGGEREEGWFFTWTPAEIRTVLGPGEASRIVEAYFGVTEGGNFEGRNILHVPRPLQQLAQQLELEPERVASEVESARQRLYTARAARPAPLRDDKILTAWNGLMISAFARGGFVLRRPEYVEQAERAADLVLRRLRVDGRLLRSYREGQARHNAYLDDHAFLIAGLIDLYQTTWKPRWIEEALALQRAVDEDYWDEDGGGYFMTRDDHETLIAREKPAFDGAEPSGNSVALMNLRRLYALTLLDAYRQRADALLAAFGVQLTRAPTSLAEMLLAVSFQASTPREIVIVARDERAQAKPLLDELRRTYVPNHVVSVAVEGDDLASQTRRLPPLRGKVARDGKATAYVCREGICRLPVTDPDAFRRQLTATDDPAVDPAR